MKCFLIFSYNGIITDRRGGRGSLYTGGKARARASPSRETRALRILALPASRSAGSAALRLYARGRSFNGSLLLFSCSTLHARARYFSRVAGHGALITRAPVYRAPEILHLLLRDLITRYFSVVSFSLFCFSFFFLFCFLLPIVIRACETKRH